MYARQFICDEAVFGQYVATGDKEDAGSCPAQCRNKALSGFRPQNILWSPTTHTAYSTISHPSCNHHTNMQKIMVCILCII